MFAARLTRFLLGLAVAGLIGASSAAADVLGEPFFPRSGSRAYDVSHYDVRLAFRPANGTLDAATRISASADQRLSSFSLDLVGLRVTGVTVDGEGATFGRGRDKLKITPETPLVRGESFTVVVHYQGRPRRVIDPDGTFEGWNRTPDGAFGVGEPLGTAAWIPCNNAPFDKAGFSFHVTVPAALKGVANGRLVSVSRKGGRKLFDWTEAQPMAPYLALIDIGRGKLVRTEIDGLPTWTMVDPALAERSRRALAALPQVVRFESKIFGPYPFDAAGSVVDFAPKLGYALETQTRPIYAFPPDLTTLVHETAHQWFGDSAGLERWPNIWLNEGFATWTEWYYAERHGGRSAVQTFRQLYRVPASNTDFWDPPSGHPGQPKNLFATSTNVRGAMALEALRLQIGTKKMLKVLRLWATEHRYGNADIAQFVALAEEVSGPDLGSLFQRWLFQRGKPDQGTASSAPRGAAAARVRR
ncbi:MAG TPA: M1 family metallopeptidase [Solirubrobacterales bacterium]|nr:M1 family metallopeptidase [Solirubrobacterales bacterium]